MYTHVHANVKTDCVKVQTCFQKSTFYATINATIYAIINKEFNYWNKNTGSSNPHC